jgi:hypothetical protein
MVDAPAAARQDYADVRTGFRAQHVDRAVALVMIHRHDDVEVTPRRVKKRRVGRRRPADVDALGYRMPDAGLDQPFLFPVSEERVLPCVRLDTADADARARNAGARERLVREADDGVDAFWRDALDRIT